MSGMSFNPQFADVDNESYVGGTITVTSSQIEAKVGGSRLTGRQNLLIFNNSNVTVYFGPSGVTTSTGIPIFKGQYQEIPAGDAIAVYLIAASGSNSVLVQELG